MNKVAIQRQVKVHLQKHPVLTQYCGDWVDVQLKGSMFEFLLVLDRSFKIILPSVGFPLVLFKLNDSSLCTCNQITLPAPNGLYPLNIFSSFYANMPAPEALYNWTVCCYSLRQKDKAGRLKRVKRTEQLLLLLSFTSSCYVFKNQHSYLLSSHLF